jgi:ArsR family transcriptional regulator
MLKQKNVSQAKKIGRLFRTLGQPARLRILLAIGKGEACVCHLEAALGYRQAYISQHLMALRKVKLVKARRVGRNIYYRIPDTEILNLVRDAGELLGLPVEDVHIAEAGATLSDCPCPNCEPQHVEILLRSVSQSSVTSA